MIDVNTLACVQCPLGLRCIRSGLIRKTLDIYFLILPIFKEERIN